jgi:hypothetical protein
VSYYLLNHLSTAAFVFVVVGVPTLAALTIVYCVYAAFADISDRRADQA